MLTAHPLPSFTPSAPAAASALYSLPNKKSFKKKTSASQPPTGQRVSRPSSVDETIHFTDSSFSLPFAPPLSPSPLLSPPLSPSPLLSAESPPPYPDQEEEEEGWDADEFDDDGAEPNATGTLQFQSDNSTEQQCEWFTLTHSHTFTHSHTLTHSHIHTLTDIGQCEAVYDYTANQSDELSIQPGDIINLIDRQSEDWWQGQIHGEVGIFPASYVQEM